MTQQIWVPDERTDEAMWRSGQSIGVGIPVPTMSIEEREVSLSDEVEAVAADHDTLYKFEVLQRGWLPLFLLACRHHRLPMPPHLWFSASNHASTGSDSPTSPGEEAISNLMAEPAHSPPTSKLKATRK